VVGFAAPRRRSAKAQVGLVIPLFARRSEEVSELESRDDVERVPSGWYPDPTDAASIRYWDGAAWSNFVTPRQPGMSLQDQADAAPGEHANGAGPADRTDGPRWEQDTEAVVPGSVQPAASSLRPIVSPLAAEPSESAVDDRGVDDDRADDDRADDDRGEEDDDRADDDWAARATAALRAARSAGTTEVWHEAVGAALVLAQMAQSLLAASEARQAADNVVAFARIAADKAEAAEQEAERLAVEADDAAEAARVAAAAAAAAKHEAEHAANAVPRARRSAQSAAAAARDAQRTAAKIEEIVAKAQVVDTGAAWSEALQRIAGKGSAGEG
jgi:Protein of unknown function (DUF2510)